MADQKLLGVHHVTLLIEQFSTKPKKPAFFKKVSSLVRFDYFS